jgi:hypothetical protein
MRQNFKRDKSRKEEARRKKQEEKRNRRLHKKDEATAPDSGISAEPAAPETPQQAL